MAGLLFDQSDLGQETNLKTIDVHNSHCTVHLSGTQPVVDLLQQPIKQHWVQGFGNGIPAMGNTE